ITTQAPRPYSFAYDNTDEFGTRLAQEESGDANNNKVGSYSYTDAAGIFRTVKYVADADGFRATVETNEPGTKTSSPADAPVRSTAVEGPHPVFVKAAPVVVKAVDSVPVEKALRPAPVTVQAVHAAPFVVKAFRPGPLAVQAVQAAPVVAVQALHAAPVAVHALHSAPVVQTVYGAPVAYALRHAPAAYAARHAPLVYTHSQVKKA
ncbi:unnamed protein product, partial [Ixodes hexagonus]